MFALRSKPKFGIEFEFDSRYTREYEINDLCDKLIPGKISQRETPKKWTIKYDCSCGPELTTPAFDLNLKSFKEIKSVLDLINKNYKKTTTYQCGLHVHISVKNMTIHQFNRFYCYMADFEPVLYRLQPSSRNAGKIRYKVIDVIEYDKESYSDDGRIDAYDSPLVYKNYYNTIEVRIAAGTSNFEDSFYWTCLLCYFRQVAISKRGEFKPEFHKNPNIKDLIKFIEDNKISNYFLNRIKPGMISWIKNGGTRRNHKVSKNKSSRVLAGLFGR